MGYKELWQGYYETAQEAGLSDEDAGCEANAKLADYQGMAIDVAHDQQKEDRFHE